MPGRISQSFFQELLTHTDIVEVINERVPLQKRGNDYLACCPFHEEKTPSFSVNTQKQFYHCFGCKKSGDAISFLMEYAHMGFVEAIESLAQQIGMEVQYEKGSAPTQSSSAFKKLSAVMETATDFYAQQLSKAPHVQQYLARRGLDSKTIETFKIGYAPPGFNSMASLFGKQHDQKLLEKAGLTKSKGDGHYYARFRDRIMFPIRNTRGQTIAFGGRLLKDDDKQPKYLNSPETPLFQKRTAIYGIYELRHVRNFNELILVEGYMDVIGLAQAGISNTVAVLGTAATTQHLTKIFSLSNRLAVCFDGDEAGRKASLSCMLHALPIFKDKFNLRFIHLPSGSDPDSLVKQQGGKETFQQLVQEAQPLSDYLFEHLKDQLDLSIPEGLSNFCARARPILATVKSNTLRELLAADMAQRAKFDVKHLYEKPPSIATRTKSIAKERPSTQHDKHEHARLRSAELNYLKICYRMGLLALKEEKEILHEAEKNEMRLLQKRWNSIRNRMDSLALKKEQEGLNEIEKNESSLMQKCWDTIHDRVEQLAEKERKEGLNEAEKNDLCLFRKCWDLINRMEHLQPKSRQEGLERN